MPRLATSLAILLSPWNFFFPLFLPHLSLLSLSLSLSLFRRSLFAWKKRGNFARTSPRFFLALFSPSLFVVLVLFPCLQLFAVMSGKRVTPIDNFSVFLGTFSRSDTLLTSRFLGVFLLFFKQNLCDRNLIRSCQEKTFIFLFDTICRYVY